MRTKTAVAFLLIGIFLMGAVCAFGTNPQAQITVRVTDDAGVVVTGAMVRARTFSKWKGWPGLSDKEYAFVVGNVDSNGVATLETECEDGEVKCWVYAPGTTFENNRKIEISRSIYYTDFGKLVVFTNIVDGQQQPWTPVVDLQIKRVLNPIPMYAMKLQMGDSRIPAFGESLCFDLEKGDWLPPHGNGQTADFIFRLDCEYGERLDSGILAFDATLTIGFSNEDDGILEFPDPQPQGEGSVFRLPRFAPESGYVNQWSLRQFAKKEGMSFLKGDENLNYFFRVRTKKDEKGKIISANYGKIRGAINFGVASRNPTIQLCYYLNPTPNDRNMEFDPKRNLFTDLPAGERVHEP